MKGDVESTELKYRNSKRTVKGKPFSLYNKDNLVKVEGRVHRGDSIILKKYEYDWNDPTKRITWTSTHEPVSRIVEYRDTIGRLIEVNVFWHTDSVVPLHVQKEFNYNSDGQVSSFVHTVMPNSRSGTRDTITKFKTCTELKYVNGLLEEKIERKSCSAVSSRTIFEYDSFGNRVKEVIDSLNPTEIVFGGRCEKGIQRFFYKFDEEGNWIKRYFEYESGKRVLEIKRKIKYRRKSA